MTREVSQRETCARGLAVGLVVGFFVGPVYFKWVYPFLYHLFLPQ